MHSGMLPQRDPKPRSKRRPEGGLGAESHARGNGFHGAPRFEQFHRPFEAQFLEVARRSMSGGGYEPAVETAFGYACFFRRVGDPDGLRIGDVAHFVC